MDTPGTHKNSDLPLAIQGILFLGALAGMVGLMYYSATYPYPGGKSLGLWGFIALWLRELGIVAFYLTCLLIGLIIWFIKLIRQLLTRLKMRLNLSVKDRPPGVSD
jgi:hypothetical protein